MTDLEQLLLSEGLNDVYDEAYRQSLVLSVVATKALQAIQAGDTGSRWVGLALRYESLGHKFNQVGVSFVSTVLAREEAAE